MLKFCVQETADHMLGDVTKLPNSLSAHSLSSSEKVDKDLVLGPQRSLCYLCLALTCHSGLKFFLRNRLCSSSRVFLFGERVFLNVCSVSCRH